MKKGFYARLALATSITVVMLWLGLYPYTYHVTIVKSEIESNRPFAGRINNQLVGTRICCEYWLDYDKMPEVATYEISHSILGGVLGYADAEQQEGN